MKTDVRVKKGEKLFNQCQTVLCWDIFSIYDKVINFNTSKSEEIEIVEVSD